MEEIVNVKSQLKISLPIAFESLINILMTLVDTLVISIVGTKELAALGAMAVILNIMQMSIQTINVSNNTLVAKSLGEKNLDKLKLVTGNSLILTLVISIFTLILIFLIQPIFPPLFNVDTISTTYLTIRLFGFIQSSIVTVLSGHQRTIGNQKNILYLRIFAVILNLTPDHLTRHHTMEAYGAAKCNIFKNQHPEDVTLLNFDDPIVKSWGGLVPGRLCWFSRREVLPQGIYMQNGDFVIAWNDTREVICNRKNLQIFGGHNEENVLAAIGAAFFAGVEPCNIAEVLKNFKGVEHRIEYTATINGVRYYNDSKATNTDSTIKALEAFDGHLILIAGGRDKLTPLEEMMQLVKTKVDTLILLGEAAERFKEAAEKAGVSDIRMVTSMKEAVELAHKTAVEPQTVLLSPACASFDMFTGFPERGRCFKQIVAELSAAEEK